MFATIRFNHIFVESPDKLEPFVELAVHSLFNKLLIKVNVVKCCQVAGEIFFFAIQQNSDDVGHEVGKVKLQAHFNFVQLVD